MFLIKQCLILFILLSSNTVFLNNVATTTEVVSSVLNNNNSSSAAAKSNDSNTWVDGKEDDQAISSKDISNTDTTADEIKNEISVNEILETGEESSVFDIPEILQGPHYEMDWGFTDKYTIRVTFDLYSLPKSLIENNVYTESKEHKKNILATVATRPSNFLKSIHSLNYFHFIIRPYNQHREIQLKMEKLIIKNTTLKPHSHFSNALRLTSLNHNEKYSICICYYETNRSVKYPDLILCQDVINDYAKFGHLRADAKHGLVFIGTQYSIIIGLLIVLQSLYSIRKRRITEYIAQHLTTTAQSIRSTLSSVSLVRQSFSSLDTAAEQQQQQQHQNQNAANSHTVQHETKAEEENKVKKRRISSQTNALNSLAPPTNEGTTSSDEAEPFLKHIPSRNHVHFLLGPGEGSEDDEDVHHYESTDTNKSSNTYSAAENAEPYGDQPDALSSMAHILDTNKPWSRHSHQTSPV